MWYFDKNMSENLYNENQAELLLTIPCLLFHVKKGSLSLHTIYRNLRPLQKMEILLKLRKKTISVKSGTFLKDEIKRFMITSEENLRVQFHFSQNAVINRLINSIKELAFVGSN